MVGVSTGPTKRLQKRTANKNKSMSNLPLRLYVEQQGVKDRLRSILGQRAPQFAAALVQIVNKNYMLQNCTPESVAGAAITAAALDLSLDPNLGEAHLVPFGDACTFMIGYKGLTQLALRSGQYHRLGWMIIREGQLVRWDELLGELEIDIAAKTSDKIIGYAAKFRLVNGFERGSFWTVEQTKAHSERYSQAVKKGKKDSPWLQHFDTMSLKTVLRDLLLHWGPKSVQMQKAMAVDNQVFTDVETSVDIDDAKAGEEKKVQDKKEEVKETVANVAKPTETKPQSETEPPTGDAGEKTSGDPSVIPQAVTELIAMLEGISFDDFKTFARMSCNKDLDDVPGYEDLSASFCEDVLTKYPKHLGKFIKAYRK